MAGTMRILRPLLVAALILGGARFVIELVDGPPLGSYVFSLTGLQLVATGYLPWRIARDSKLGVPHLWLSLTLLFAFSQLIYASSVAGFHYFGQLNPNSLGMNQPPSSDDLSAHLFLHFKVWVLLLPPLVTLFVGLPLFALSRRWIGWRESDNAS